MDATRWERVQGLFHQAADLPHDEQQPFLDAACAGDPSLAADVLAMLDEDRRGHPLLDGGMAPMAGEVLGRGSPLPVGDFGRYRLTSMLGEGGMGVVYRAERADLGSTVAIKILRDAWLSPSRRDRFAAEQRTLAQLNHPSIATIHDADTLPDGTPWFVMEYVEGVPLTTFCREHLPAIEGRLALLRDVCTAVQHAHEHLVVHRDLKPSNILVKADGTVKLLDFGIAKQLDEHARPSDRTLTGLRLMTPAYASPQQVRGEEPGVDTDVYSLGVILYELLTDTLPFNLEQRTPAEADAIILGREPEKPSAAAAARARTEERTIVGSGLPASSWADLDVLCLTAMHKDTARRYRTVQALIRDIDHFLAGEPLEARPDSFTYRTGKFVRRNRGPLVGAGAAVVGIVGLVAFYTFRLARARNAAVAEAARAQRIQQFMLNLFEGGDREAGPAEDLRVMTLLERGVREADALANEPVAQAELYQTLGHLHHKLGRFEQADALLALALEKRRMLFGDAAPEVGSSLVAIAGLRTDQAQYDEAERLAREALARAARALPPEHPVKAAATEALGRILQERGSYAEAIPVLQEAVRLHERSGETVELANSLHELANAYFYSGRYDESHRLNTRTLGIYRRLFGENHPHVGDTLINLGAVAFERGDLAESERLYRDGLAITEAWHGADHFRTANNLTMLGRTLVRQGKLGEAAEVLERALIGRERTYGPDHSSVASVLNELGTIARKEKRLDDAEARYRRMAEIYRAIYKGSRHSLIGVAVSNLGSVEHDRGHFDEAERLLGEALDIFTDVLPADHTNIGIARVKLGGTLLAQRRFAEAARETLAGYEILRKSMKADAPWMADARKTLVRAYEALNEPEEAAAFRTVSDAGT